MNDVKYVETRNSQEYPKEPSNVCSEVVEIVEINLFLDREGGLGDVKL